MILTRLALFDLLIITFAASLVCTLSGCAPKSAVTSNAPIAAEPATMAGALESCVCGFGELRGTGGGKTENEAFAQAYTDISSQIQSSITATSEYSKKQRMAEGREKLESAYDVQVTQTTELLNAQDVRRQCLKRDGENFGVVACMSIADAAKPYRQSQIRLQDSIEFASLFGIKAAYPKQKNDARRQVNSMWARMLDNQELLKSWGIEVDISRAKGFRDASEEDYKDYCRTAKLHWSQEQGNLYSDMAFSRLSRKLKIEKSPCEGRGIALVYRNAEPRCDFAGVYRCTFAPTLLIAACDGTEYMLLKGPDVGSFHNNEDVSLEKLQNKLREESFWNDWEYEILQWRPLCE